MDSASLQQRLRAIQQELAAGNYDLAATLAVPCAEDYPDSGRAQELCGIALHSIGDFAAALGRLEISGTLTAVAGTVLLLAIVLWLVP